MPHGARSLHARLLQDRDSTHHHSTRLRDHDSIRLTVNLSRSRYSSLSIEQRRSARVCVCVCATARHREGRTREEGWKRSVEFDRDVAHGRAKLCKTSRPSSTFARFSYRRSPPRQDLPLNQTPSHPSLLHRDETKNCCPPRVSPSIPRYPTFSSFPRTSLFAFFQIRLSPEN